MEKTNSVYLDGLVSVCHGFQRLVDGGVEADFTLSTAIANPDATAEMTIRERVKEFMHHRVKVTAGPGAEADRLTALAESCRHGETELRIYKAKGVLIELNEDSVVLCDSKDFQKSSIMTLSNNNEAVIVGTIDTMSHSDAFGIITLDTGVSKVKAFFPKSTFRVAWESISSGKLGKGDLLSMKGPLLNQSYTDGNMTIRFAVLTPHQMKQFKLKEDLTSRRKKSHGVE